MRSLFFKIFACFWLSHLIVVLLVFAILSATQQRRENSQRAENGRGNPPRVVSGAVMARQARAVAALWDSSGASAEQKERGPATVFRLPTARNWASRRPFRCAWRFDLGHSGARGKRFGAARRAFRRGRNRNESRRRHKRAPRRCSEWSHLCFDAASGAGRAARGRSAPRPFC
jgi:hypothetical protein